MSTPFVGEIRLFGFGRTPNGWQACNGSLLSIAEYEVLYMLIGTTFGGDGQTTFAVPDMRSRVPVHQGQGPGLSNYVIGQVAGTESVTLTVPQIPAHTHTMLASSLGSTSTTPVGQKSLAGVSGDTLYSQTIPTSAAIVAHPGSISVAGGSQPHENLMPTLTVQFCIAWAGIYPSQS